VNKASPAFAGKDVPSLTPDQKSEFERNGFIIVEDALDAEEVAHFRSVIDRLDHDVEASYGGQFQDQPRQPGERLELRNAVAAADELLDLMVHPSAFPLLVQLMNEHIALTTSHVFIRPTSPKDVDDSFKQIGWHRDGPAYPCHQNESPERPWLYTKIGYFLTDTTIPDCGALRVVPGSHRYNGPAPEAKNSSEPHGAVDVGVKPGTAVIFDNRVLHAVGPNRSPIARENVYFGYCWRYLRAIDFVQQEQSLLDKCTPIQRQLLGDATSPLGYYLPKEDDTPLRTLLEN
jgi:ectoine hydroxylase-related dioxygenase (phytanoyl-CoA dioxygenase family)